MIVRWLRRLISPRTRTRRAPDPDLARIRERQRVIWERVNILGLEVDLARRKRRADPA